MPTNRTGSASELWVVDYPGHRREGRISDLRLGLEGYRETALLESPLPTATTAEEYAASLLQRRHLLRSGVDAIIGHCAAASIVHYLAVMTGCRFVVLLDAELPTFDDLTREFRQILRTITSEDRKLPEWCIPESLRADRQAFVAGLREHLMQALVALPFASEDGLDTDVADTLGEAYVDWLRYLVAGYEAHLPAWQGCAAHVISQEHALPLPWPASDVTVTRVPSGRYELMGNPDTRVAVTRMLEGALVGGP